MKFGGNSEIWWKFSHTPPTKAAAATAAAAVFEEKDIDTARTETNALAQWILVRLVISMLLCLSVHSDVCLSVPLDNPYCVRLSVH